MGCRCLSRGCTCLKCTNKTNDALLAGGALVSSAPTKLTMHFYLVGAVETTAPPNDTLLAYLAHYYLVGALETSAPPKSTPYKHPLKALTADTAHSLLHIMNSYLPAIR